MNRFILFAVLILFAISLRAQDNSAWGKVKNTVIQWGEAFHKTDSLKIRTAATEIDTSEVVYTSIIYGKENEVGMCWIDFDCDSSDAPSDSIKLDVRFWTNSDIHPNRPWTKWYNIGGFMKSDTLYQYDIADSSWNRPGGKQFRCYRQDVAKDTLNDPGLGLYQN